ncbi:MAG TPA: CocE/NonD family hydrolase C-terminal non-catalytic domain-containing protein, partial [Waddliaceae bacterium]
SLAPQISVAKVDYPSKTGAIIFFTPPFMENTEITGPIRLKLWVSSTTDAVDLFVIIKKFDSNKKEIVEVSTSIKWVPISACKQDPVDNKPYQPLQIHDQIFRLTPGEIFPVEVEILPSAMVFEAGTILAVVVGAKDDATTDTSSHKDRADQAPASSVPAINTIWTGSNYDSSVLLPVIP